MAAVHIRGVVREILLSFVVTAVPMLAFSTLLLGLVFRYRITTGDAISPDLRPDTFERDGSAIYVDLSATTLTTVASWSSTVAPLILPFIMTLISFPVARNMLHTAQQNEMFALPTPYQFSLMLRMLCNASFGSIWHCLTYIFGWRGKRQPQALPMAVMAWTLAMSSVFSLLVFATDTWLHFTTKTVLLTRFSPTTLSSASFPLTSNCTDVQASFEGGCNLNPAGANTFLISSDFPLRLLSNVSSIGTVKPLTANGVTYAYLAVTPSSLNANVDFTAKSWAVESHCEPATRRCINEDSISGVAAPYKCDFAMEGVLKIDRTVPDALAFEMVYFTDSSATNNLTSTASMPNPYTYAAVFSINQNIGWHADLISDPDVMNGGHGSTIVALLCNATVYDIEYTSVNGSTTRFAATASNSSTTNVIMGGQAYTQVGGKYILQRTSLDVWESHTAQEVADRFANVYSQTALAVAAGAFTPSDAVEAQQRSETLVAKVPKAPLVCLVLANLLLVVLGLILTIAASVTLSHDVGDVQARISIAALVAAHFEQGRGEGGVEDVLDMSDERQGISGPKVAIEKNANGGWSFSSRIVG